jgi:hypothetical protein
MRNLILKSNRNKQPSILPSLDKQLKLPLKEPLLLKLSQPIIGTPLIKPSGPSINLFTDSSKVYGRLLKDLLLSSIISKLGNLLINQIKGLLSSLRVGYFANVKDQMQKIHLHKGVRAHPSPMHSK